MQGTIINKRPPLKDGWHDLPGGGSVEIKNNYPVQICDKGRRSLDENKILAEVAEYTQAELQWPSNSRAKRWHPIGLVNALFNAIMHVPSHQNWSYATVLVTACWNCGVHLGECWIDLPTEPFREWVCEVCAEDIATLEIASEDEEP